MDIMQELKEFRNKIDSNVRATRNMIRVDDLTPEEIQEIIGIYDRYEVDKDYVAKDIFQYKGQLYEVISAHTSQEDWVPNELPAIYKSFSPEDVIDVWVQPLGSHDSYSKGEKVIYNDLVYISTVDNNVWEPTNYGWELDGN